MTDKDAGLIRFLARNNHRSPFRHCSLQFEIKAPLMVSRQHWKYVVGSDHTMDGWNEMSKRYVTEQPSFYVPEPDEWREKPADSKQGSGNPINEADGSWYSEMMKLHVTSGLQAYEAAIEDGVAPEQARLFLPANGMYTRYYWTASLESVSHVINQRVASDSQYEFQQYAKAIKALAIEKFPVSLAELLK